MKRFPFKTVLFGALMCVVLIVFSCAQTRGARRFGDAEVCVPDPSRISVLGLTLGKNTLSDARNLLGPALVAMGEYRHEPYVMCYVSADPSDTTTLTFQTDFFGDWERLTQFELSGSPGALVCAESGLVQKGLETQCGLKLGMSRGEFEAIMGEPGLVRDNVLKYMYIAEERLAPERRERMAEFGIVAVDYDVITTIVEAEFDGEKLVRLKVSWSESV